MRSDHASKFMRMIVSVFVLAAILFPGLVFADTNATFDWGVVISEYRHYEPPFTTSDSYYMLCAAGVDTNEYPVYVQNIPDTSGDTFLYYIPGWDDINQDYTFARPFMSPAPGGDWENITYTFYIDVNQNEHKDEGDPATTWNIPQGSIFQMPLVQNVCISAGCNPTITWDAAPNADTYRIRFVPIKDGNPDFSVGFFQSDEFSGSSSYSFNYNGTLFNDCGPIAIVIEAWEDYNDLMINRSRYIVKHDPCKKAMPWIPLLLLDKKSPSPVPTGLSTNDVSSNQINLSWNASIGDVAVSGYKIYRDGVYLKSVTETSTTDTGLNALTRYCYTISAYDADGNESSQSDEVCVTTNSTNDTYTNSLGMTFKLIPAGTFTMGSPSDESCRDSNETQHQVTLTQSFYMQTTEVTQGQWNAVMGSNPSHFSSCGDDCPVEKVSWNDVQTFITTLNDMGQGTYRLPTEAEWEYAARAGSTTAFANGDITVTECNKDPNLDAMGWYCYNAGSTTHPVAQKQANGWGLYDMHGNVWEWVRDWYEDYPSSDVSDPTGPSSGSYRVYRGGCWYSYAEECRSAYRFAGAPDDTYNDLGFRLLRDASGILSITLDNAGAGSAEVGPEGGTLSTTGSEGSSYSLVFPAGALQDAQEISITPISHIQGLPIGQDALVAVHLGPSGLKLKKPVTVTIEPLPPLSPGKIPVGFVIEDDGQTYRVAAMGIQGNRACMKISSFSIAAVEELTLQQVVDFIDEKYYGKNGLLKQLTHAKSCDDPALEEAITLMINFQKFNDQIGAGYMNIEIAARDCIYPLGSDWWNRCTCVGDHENAAKESLVNRILEIFREKDDDCKSDPDKEIEALECIALAAYLGEKAVIKDPLFGETLFKEKTCGLFDLDVKPDNKYMNVSDSIPFQAVATDKAGNQLIGREVVWDLGFDSDAVTMVAEPHTALITADKPGLATITAFDKMSLKDVYLGIFGLGRRFTPVWGYNCDTSKIMIEGSVEVTPSKLVLIPPDVDVLKSKVFDTHGKDITSLTGWVWTSSKLNVATVTSEGEPEAVVFPVSPGTAIITATDTHTGLKGAAEVVVGAKVSVTPPEVCLREFESKQLSATLVDYEGYPIPGIGPYDIVWSSPAPSIASVSIDGVVVAKSVGKVKIKATYKNSTGFATVTVPDLLPENYEVTPVYSPETFVWNGIEQIPVSTGGYRKLYSQYRLNDDRELMNCVEEVFNIADRCGIVDELLEILGDPKQYDYPYLNFYFNNNGWFTYRLWFSEGGPYNTSYAYLFDSNTCKEFELPVPSRAFPAAINDKGQVAGTWEYVVGDEGRCKAFIYDHESGSVEYLAEGTVAKDINNKGEVLINADSHPYVYYNGAYTKISTDVPGVPPPAQPGDISCRSCGWHSINDQGVIVGHCSRLVICPTCNVAFINYQDENVVLKPPFPPTLPVQDIWEFWEINNYNDILIHHWPNRLEEPELYEEFKDFNLSIMHLCPLPVEQFYPLE